MFDFINIINEYKKAQKNLICVEIIESTGSTPRTKGTLMLVDATGKAYGSIVVESLNIML